MKLSFRVQIIGYIVDYKGFVSSSGSILVGMEGGRRYFQLVHGLLAKIWLKLGLQSLVLD